MGVKCKLVENTGWRFYLRIYWGSVEPTAHGNWSYHDATRFVQDYPRKTQPEPIRDPESQEEYERYKDLWPKKCDICDAIPPPFTGQHSAPIAEGKANYQFFWEKLYDNPPRELQPGDMVWAEWAGTELDPRGHLMVCGPNYTRLNRLIWDTMSTATNCNHTDKAKSHYCWQRSGEPPNCSITPSILIGDYHGFLTNGEFNP